MNCPSSKRKITFVVPGSRPPQFSPNSLRYVDLHSPSSESSDEAFSPISSPILFNEETSSILRMKEKKSMIEAAKDLMRKSGGNPDQYKDWDRILHM